MGRRSSHTPEELRELIIKAATDLIERSGLSGLSAREIARQIGYSPGTLYNVFADIDDLVLTIEYRLLERLSLHLAEVPRTSDPTQHLCDLAAAYLAFTQERPRLWNLLFEHHMPQGWKVPALFHARMESLLVVVEQALHRSCRIPIRRACIAPRGCSGQAFMGLGLWPPPTSSLT